MNADPRKVQALRPEREVITRQGLPYFIGISGQTVGALGLAMRIVVIPPGARAIVARNDPAEQDKVEPYVVSSLRADRPAT